jgi:hypothetical protein
LPWNSYTLTLLAATVLVDMSRTKGRFRRAGAAKAMGLVGSIGTAPRAGSTATVRAEVVTIPIMPASAAMDA